MLVDNVLAQTDYLLPLSKGQDMTGYYFVAARTDTGARFYSEPIQVFRKAVDAFDAYCDLVQYFGGTVELFAIDPDDFTILATTRI